MSGSILAGSVTPTHYLLWGCSYRLSWWSCHAHTLLHIVAWDLLWGPVLTGCLGGPATPTHCCMGPGCLGGPATPTHCCMGPGCLGGPATPTHCCMGLAMGHACHFTGQAILTTCTIGEKCKQQQVTTCLGA